MRSHKKIALALALCALFASFGFRVLLAAIARQQVWRITCASVGFAIAVSFVMLLLAQIKLQRQASGHNAD